MIGVLVTFEGSEGLDRAALTGIAESARGMFEGMPGLRSKSFTVADDGSRARNFYVWDDEEKARAFFTDEMRGQIAEVYGVTPDIELLDVLSYVDNA
jgi:hypothetical protein